MISPPTVSVIVPTHNRSDALAGTLSCLEKQIVDVPWEVIVVNNRCTDNTDEVVAGVKFPVPLSLVQEEVPGPAAARNAGAGVAGGEYLIFIDNDILTKPDFVQRHLDALKAHPGCWIVGQVINLPEQETTPFGRFRKFLYPFVPPTEGFSETNGITGQSMSLPRSDFERLGGFDPSFFVASGEDRELMMRAWTGGIKLLFDPANIVVHNDWAGSSIEDYCTRQRIYTQTEPLFWRKYGDDYPRQQLVRENLPPDLKRDGFFLVMWKRMKQMLGSSAGQWIVIGACSGLERLMPWPPLLWRLYRLALAGAIYKGFQEGLQIENKSISGLERESPVSMKA